MNNLLVNNKQIHILLCISTTFIQPSSTQQTHFSLVNSNAHFSFRTPLSSHDAHSFPHISQSTSSPFTVCASVRHTSSRQTASIIHYTHIPFTTHHRPSSASSRATSQHNTHFLSNHYTCSFPSCFTPVLSMSSPDTNVLSVHS